MFFDDDYKEDLFQQALDDESFETLITALEAQKAVSASVLVEEGGPGSPFAKLQITAQPAGDGNYSVTTMYISSVDVTDEQRRNVPQTRIDVGKPA
jgi:hypothetical protein